MALTEAQKRAQKTYNEKNKERRNYLRRRGAARDFIIKDKHLTLEDVAELEMLIAERKKALRSQ